MAQRAGAGRALVVAGFLHDIGHMLLNEHAGRDDFLCEDRAHEDVGARFLCCALSPSVTEVVRLHVDAKRYLCAVEADYHAGLSEASRRSLALHGGTFSAAEARRWAEQPFATEAAQLRRWEDEDKCLCADGEVREAALPCQHELMREVQRLL